MMATKSLIITYANDHDLQMENKKVQFLVKISFLVITSSDDVITSKFYLVWKAIIKGLNFSYDVVHGMVPLIQKFDLGVHRI
jgi:hypothetical protein